MKRVVIFLFIGLLLLVGCRQPMVATDPTTLYQGAIEPDKINLLFPAVGQGDACLVTFPTGERIMIDTGPFESRDMWPKYWSFSFSSFLPKNTQG